MTGNLIKRGNLDTDTHIRRRYCEHAGRAGLMILPARAHLALMPEARRWAWDIFYQKAPWHWTCDLQDWESVTLCCLSPSWHFVTATLANRHSRLRVRGLSRTPPALSRPSSAPAHASSALILSTGPPVSGPKPHLRPDCCSK